MRLLARVDKCGQHDIARSVLVLIRSAGGFSSTHRSAIEARFRPGGGPLAEP